MAPENLREGLQVELKQTPGDFQPGVGINNYLAAAMVAAGRARGRWEDREDEGVELPGFGTLGLPEGFLDELDGLIAWAKEAERAARREDSEARRAALGSAQMLLVRLRGISRWYARLQKEFRLQLQTLEENHARGGASAKEVALRLDDYVALMTPVSDQIKGIAGFEVEKLEEAATLSKRLIDVGKARRVRLLRNKLLQMIEARYSMLREGARLLFGEHTHLLDDFNFRAPRRSGGSEEEAEAAPPASADEEVSVAPE